MYPWFRFFTVSFKATRAEDISIDSVCKTELRCMPWDLDMFLEMNNGRILTLYDLGRFDLSIRTGLARVLKEHRWGLVVAGSSVRYRHRVKLFDKIKMCTQVVGFADRWIYIVQSMWVNGKPTSSVLLRTGITSKGKLVPSDDVLNALGIVDWKPELPAWVESWIASEAERPWPP